MRPSSSSRQWSHAAFSAVAGAVSAHRRIVLTVIAAWLVLALASIVFPQRTVFISAGDADLSYQVYWFDQGFTEENSLRLDTPDFLQGDRSFQTGVSFPAGESGVFRFDIDPRPRVDREHMHLPLEPFAVLPVVVSEYSLFHTRRAWYDDPAILTQHSGVERDGDFYRVTGEDAFFVVDLSRAQPRIVEGGSWNGAFALLLLGMVAAAAKGVQVLARSGASRPLFAVACVAMVVLGMCLSFGLGIGRGHGPDEVMHFPSYFWYQEHLRPPSLGDPVYLQKVWKSSYVLGASGDLGYLLTARTEAVLEWLLPGVTPLVSMRLAQGLLIASGLGLAVLLMGVQGGMAYLMAWLVVPQLAYTATYLNGDVMAFVLSFLGLGLALVRAPTNAWWLLPAAFLMLNVKANYLVLVLLLPLIWILIPDTRPRLSRTCMAVLVAALPLFLFRRVYNWFDQARSGKSYLQDAYDRLVTEQDTTLHPFSYARASYERRLAGLEAFDWSVLTDVNWYLMSFRSLFGVFGYMEFMVPAWVIAPSVGAFLVVTWFSVRGRRRVWVLSAAVAISISASLFYSISEGYQPQGRYLFPVLCVVFLLARERLYRHAEALSLAALPTLLALSMYRLQY